MKKLLLKTLKVLLIITLVVLLALVVVGLVLWLNWPWWVAGFILVGCFGCWLVWLFLRKILSRRREQQFVGEVIEQDEAFIKGISDSEKEGLKDLQNRWQESIEALRASHLKKSGNPLYVLPWYMIIGESGSGKTTAIQSAQLSSPFAETNRVSGLSGTRNCDWWFFEQAIILDTAGRYAIPVDESRDKEEWQKFLTLLVKYRKKEPLNGLVVTVSADKLLEGDKEVLAEDGRNIRRRIDELMRVMGNKFPVYVLVTKCDLVQGMTQFCDSLPEKALDQAMGVAKQNLKTDIRGFLTRTTEVMGERLRELRLLLLHRSSHTLQGTTRPKPDLLLFPEEFQGLNHALAPFVEAAFQDNPYQEAPLLRGIYFSSGRQEGTPYSHFLNSLGLIEERQVLPGTSRGLFLHELFARILPRDRKLFAPTQRSLAWGRVTRNIGLAGWLALGLAVCGLLSFAFVKNLGTIRIASNEFAKPTLLKGEILTDVQILERHRQAVLRMESHNRNWWIPRFGLHTSLEVEEDLKRRYCKKFNDHFTANFDPILTQSVAKFSLQTEFEVVAPHVAHLTRRINLLSSRLNQPDLEQLQKQPRPSYQLLLYTSDTQLAPELSSRITDLYLYYLYWQTDSDLLSAEHQRLRNLLQHILTINDLSLNWLIAWVNTNPEFNYLTLQEFWGDQLTGEGSAKVPPAFTTTGRKAINGLISEIEAALIDPMIIAGKKVDFQTWYPQAYTK
ncbi:MAG: type VI secretion protein IcmF/TssM N-terminal domain-containing protein, partial [Desulfobacterales bacterium]